MAARPVEATESGAAPSGEEEDRQRAFVSLTSGTARIATATGVRQVLTTGALAFTAIAVARFLGPRSFGLYVGGTAAFGLSLGLCDLGFSLVLVRELAKRPNEAGRLMGTALRAQVAWCIVLTVFLCVLGIIAGGTRGLVMLIMAPALTFSGLAVSRSIFSVRFRALPLLVMDVSTTLLQCAVMLVLVLAHAPIVVLAANLSVWTCLSGALALILARHQVAIEVPTRSEVLRFARTALPLGLASVLASLYFTIDLTLLGWLVLPRALGRYAVAVRLLNLVVMIPGFVMLAGIPGLTRAADRRADLSRFAATLAKWIALTALPIGVAIAVFARPAVLDLFGPSYLGAVPLVRILMLAALLAFSSNVTGIVMVSLGIIRPQIIFNTISLIVNVIGNILLVPRYGVVASAWLTVVSEGIVVSYGLVTLRKRISYLAIVGAVSRPLVAVVIAAATAWLLGGTSPVAAAGSAGAFLVVMLMLGAFPTPRPVPTLRTAVDWFRGPPESDTTDPARGDGL
jgi:O-antigen/teichoic acid export membrane protein